MFSTNQGLWWSPGGRHVAYVETNDTEVHTIEYSWYGDKQYPSTVSIPYPKVGHAFRMAQVVLGSVYCWPAWNYLYYLVYLFLLYSQVLPTRLWDCLSWTLTTQQKLLRLLFQPHLAQGNEMSSVILLNFKNQKHTGAWSAILYFLSLLPSANITWPQWLGWQMIVLPSSG